ncbi:hypothetical protein DW974_16960 [Lachnospiraceae bacterium AM48-27BH]|nr:hypothetical protein DW974_16960 [Lachnospiraceae bacterium AM48-27BH]
MARKTGLGRGLGAIFGTDVVESVEESLHQPEKKEENHVHVKHLDVKRYIQLGRLFIRSMKIPEMRYQLDRQ